MKGINPGMFFLFALVLLYVASWAGSWLSHQYAGHAERHANTFKTLEGSVLALLGLLLGFTFSMAISRYTERQQAEIAEANAIYAAYLHTATLADPARSEEQALFRAYMPVRLDFLLAGTSQEKIATSLKQTDALGRQMWNIGADQAVAHPDPTSASFLSSLDTAFSAAETRTAAYENRIPSTAWALLIFIATIAVVIVGIGIHSGSRILRAILPVIVAAALAQTLDLDSPRSGLIRIHQHSMDRIAQQIATFSPKPAQ